MCLQSINRLLFSFLVLAVRTAHLLSYEGAQYSIDLFDKLRKMVESLQRVHFAVGDQLVYLVEN